jgi:antitoxin (DNA-binding transcriptional repressor) of toxin-antitoxin stability system
MVCISVNDAKDDLAACLKRAVAGEEIAIDSDGTLVALKPLPANKSDQARIQKVIDEIRANPPLSKAKGEELIREIREQRKAWKR